MTPTLKKFDLRLAINILVKSDTMNFMNSLMKSGDSADDTGQISIHRLSETPTKAWEKIKVKQVVNKVEPLDPSIPITEDNIRFVCISDTHSKIERLGDFLPPGDVLLHAGDITEVGHPSAIAKFNTYLGSLPHKVKIIIAGNHDLTFDIDMVKNQRDELKGKFGITPHNFENVLQELGVKCSRDLLTECIYLEDSSIDVCGIKVYGSPWQPEFFGWGFNLPRGAACLEKWNLIPEKTDILITHGPPIGHGDKCFGGERAGCVELLSIIQNRVKPRFHLFGHIHEGYGITSDGTTTFINASTCTLRYKPTNPPVVFDFPIPEGHSKEELLQIPVNNLQHQPDS